MSLTANFDYCFELGIASVKEIFHLAFKSEDRYPHNVGPLDRVLSGRAVQVEVRVLDDDTDAADLSFADPKEMSFSFPFEITITVPEAPDPSLSRITIEVRVEVPAALESWTEDDEPVLGLSFFGLTAAAVTVGTIGGLPSIDAGRFAAAVHSRYDTVPHTYTLGSNVLVIYDGTRDTTLAPPNAATPSEITVSLESPGGVEHVKLIAPLHVTVPLPAPYGTYLSYGKATFWRPVTRTAESVSVDMTAEPADPNLATKVELDNSHPARSQVITQLTPLVRNTLAGFGVITEPGFTEAGARELTAAEVAAYLSTRRYPVYSPKSGDPAAFPLSDPVGFLLVDDGVLAVLLNRRDDTVEDVAPENFLGGNQLALAVGRQKVDELIATSIRDEFGDLSTTPYEVHEEEGDATLYSLSVTPSDAGEHEESVGHLWAHGTAEVHIDCWPDPDVTFDGPIYVDAIASDTDEGCELKLEPRAGDFDIDQSCCDVFLDILIPIVGWVMLAVVESTIDEVGGRLIEDLTEAQGEVVAPIPPEVNGIAEVTGCLTGLTITSRGFILPGNITIRRLSESFEDRMADGDQPRP